MKCLKNNNVNFRKGLIRQNKTGITVLDYEYTTEIVIKTLHHVLSIISKTKTSLLTSLLVMFFSCCCVFTIYREKIFHCYFNFLQHLFDFIPILCLIVI